MWQCSKKHSLIALLLLLLAGGGLPPSSYGQQEECKDRTITFEEEKSADGAHIYLSTVGLLEATVRLSGHDLVNIRPSHALPYDFTIQSANHKEVLGFSQIQSGRFKYYWNYHFIAGVPSQLATHDYTYSLPYSSSEQHKVLQSYFGTYSHQKGTADEYAVDFEMPIGTEVHAARDGKVIAIRNDSSVGGADKRFIQCANYIVIKHGDGTYANYCHLQKGTNLVTLGQTVRAGSAIGLSGCTGYAASPHLHFKIYRVVDAETRPSLPFRIRTEEGVLSELAKGHSY